jgi:hypothetical protein
MPITQILLTAGTGGGGGGGGSTADFTIEWFQKVEGNGQNSRPWSIGLYPTQSIAISYESHTSDFYWINNSAIGNVAQVHAGAGWEHMAFVRSSGVVYGYRNGSQYFSVPFNSPITNSSSLFYVGTGEMGAGMYQGYLTNLHVMKGVAKYTGNFTPPTTPIVATTGSVFLMNASNSGSPFTDSASGKVTGTVAGPPQWSSDSPFTALGPYTALYPASSANILYILKTSYPDIANVQAGWSATADDFSGTVTSRTSTDLLYHIVTINVASGSFGGAAVTFTQPGLGSIYFDSSRFVAYPASTDWAMDV